MSANERQVAGQHYRDRTIQHWDLMAMFLVPYFEGQITKYVDRHRGKNKSQDLRKAHHFAEKLLEVTGSSDPTTRCAARFDPVTFSQFVRGSKLDARQIGVYLLALTWSSRRDLEDLVRAIDEYDVECYPPPVATAAVPVYGIADSIAVGDITSKITAGTIPSPKRDPDRILVGIGARVFYMGNERDELKGRQGTLVGVTVPRGAAGKSLDLSAATASVLFDGVAYSFFNETTKVPFRDLAPADGSWA